ncbi:non-heme iron oxygenase ferredoxin subunit [Prauserella sp. PE36]|uniref:non-heme iron oxygenase ferredoxin subunit n=1 Tax=Prauserella sp. PE36 TaxID=1504709 RepID=UPI001F490625|nr:non-heme iron oxygenase ferredoxin subunit [Prauserella sp. PE36]
MTHPPSTGLVYLCETAEVPEDEGLRVRHPELPEPVAVFRDDDGNFRVLADACSHGEASLADGWVEGGYVECPLHFSRFDLKTGSPCSLPAMKPVNAYPVTVVDGKLYLDHSE